jgi:hypothetical protein
MRFAKTFRRRWQEYVCVDFELKSAQDVADYLSEVLADQTDCEVAEPREDPVEWWRACMLILHAGKGRVHTLPWMVASRDPRANRQACRYIMQAMVTACVNTIIGPRDHHILKFAE